MITSDMVKAKVDAYFKENGIDRESIKKEREIVYAEFNEKFGIDVLKNLTDETLLSALFSTLDNTQDNLYRVLGAGEKNLLTKYAGSMAGVFAAQFGLYQDASSKEWKVGNNVITEDKALEIGIQIRNFLVNSGEYLLSHPINTEEDVASFVKYMQDIITTCDLKIKCNYIWIQKYFHILFPNRISNFYTSKWQKHACMVLGIKLSEENGLDNEIGSWLRTMQIAKFYTENGLPIMSIAKLFGSPKSFYRIGCSKGSHIEADDLSGSLYANKIIGIGWPRLGDLSQYAVDNKLSKDKIKQAIIEKYEYNSKQASNDANNILDFYNADNDAVFVPVLGNNHLLGLVDNIGNYFYDTTLMENFVNFRKGIWHSSFDADDRWPGGGGGIFIKCKKISDSDYLDMEFLYEHYFYHLDEGDFSWSSAPVAGEGNGTEIEKMSNPMNLIYFGAPGTGKSYELNERRKELLGIKITDDTDSIAQKEVRFERVTFHPDYTYAKFVGTYKPVPKSEDKISYEYVPGPFIRLLTKALKDKDNKYLLLIEEINRANVAAVFGDVFQLLDRDDNGASEYPVQTSEDMRKYLEKELKNYDIDCEQIAIPENMYIWASMNSADQGVFPMDTAFKRRWDFKYIGINSGESEMQDCNFKVNGQEINWNRLRKAINDELAEQRINEDKLMGPFFIKKQLFDKGDNEAVIKAIKSKVLMYLFEDAAKQKRDAVFAKDGQNDVLRYSQICRNFDIKGIEVFSINIQNRYNSVVD